MKILKKVSQIIDLRRCDGCGSQSDSIEQSTCLTAHVESDNFKFNFKECPQDYFYCKDCLTKDEFCKNCDKTISHENKKIILEKFHGKKF